MEKPISMKTFHGSLAMKSRTDRDIDAYFSSYLTIDDPIFELSFFDAHKSFFNQANNHHIQKLTISSSTRVSPLGGDVGTDYADARNYTQRSFGAVTATTASSEANWINSHTGLFRLLSGGKPVSMSNQSRCTDLKKKIKASLSKPLRLCRRKCPCADKKSVQVKEMKPAAKTQVPAPPPPPPFPSNNPNARVSHKSKVLESNPRVPIEKPAMSETAANKSEAHKTPISPNNMVDRASSNQDVLITKSQMFHTAENDDEASTILQPQQVMACVKPVTDGFTFPLLNPKSVEEDPPCNSLDVFGPPYIEPRCVPQSPKSGIVDDDAASDASSDLFEIVNFPTQATSTQSGTNADAKPLDTIINSGFLFKGKESMTRTITEKYESSEASIDWSMSSGEGFEFDTTGDVNLPVKASESGDGGEAHGATTRTHLVGSPLAMCRTAHISLAFAT